MFLKQTKSIHSTSTDCQKQRTYRSFGAQVYSDIVEIVAPYTVASGAAAHALDAPAFDVPRVSGTASTGGVDVPAFDGPPVSGTVASGAPQQRRRVEAGAVHRRPRVCGYRGRVCGYRVRVCGCRGREYDRRGREYYKRITKGRTCFVK